MHISAPRVCVCVSLPVPSAQMAGLLCEEEGPGADNVKYCGYCKHHYNKMVRRCVKTHNKSIVKNSHRLKRIQPSDMSLLKIKTTLTILFLTPLEEADWSGSQHDATRVQNRYFCKQEKLVPGFDLVVHLTVFSVCFGFYSRRSCAPVRTHKAAPLLIPGGALALHRRTNTTTTGRGRLEVRQCLQNGCGEASGTIFDLFVCVREGRCHSQFIISILLHQFLCVVSCWKECYILPPLYWFCGYKDVKVICYYSMYCTVKSAFYTVISNNCDSRLVWSGSSLTLSCFCVRCRVTRTKIGKRSGTRSRPTGCVPLWQAAP